MNWEEVEQHCAVVSFRLIVSLSSDFVRGLDTELYQSPVKDISLEFDKGL